MESKIDLPTPPKLDYPCLMLSNRGTVVLMTGPHQGTVVYGNKLLALGTYSCSWSSGYWKPFTGSVKLEN